MRSTLLIISLLLFSHHLLYSQKEFTAVKTEVIVEFDSIPVNHASPVQFTQLEPEKGEPASYPTEMFFLYDSLNIYFYARCNQPANSVVAMQQNRDVFTTDDDAIVLMLDTYNDGRSAYGFSVNPLGTLVDFKIVDDGRTLDVNWDTEWDAQTSITDDYWDVLFTIPFKSLRGKAGQTSWGFNVARVIRSNAETSWWSGEMNEDFRVSQSGRLIGLEIPANRQWLTLYPYATIALENNEKTGIDNEVKFEAGGDVRFKIKSSVQADLTFNPDFATVEGDQERINLSRYELSYPEKRLFFLEGNEMFGTRIKSFYSRRIGDIDYGGKVTGKLGDYSFNALSVKSSLNSELDSTGAWYSAVRVKKDVLKSSNVGLTLTDKRWPQDNVTSLSGDYLLNLGNSWKLTGQFVASWPGDFWNSSGFFVRFARESNIYHYHIRFASLGTNFQENVNQTGFISDDDRNEFDSDVSYKWWFNKSNVIMYLSAITMNNVFFSRSGTLRSWYSTTKARLYLKNKLSLDLKYNNEYKLYEKDYYNHIYGITLGYNTDEWSSVELDYQTGRNFDRDFYLLSWNGTVKVFKKISIAYTGNYLHFNPDTTNASTVINVLSVNYYFTKDLWMRVFAQNKTNNERVYIYGLVGWRFKPPFGAVYLIYSKDDMMFYPENQKYSQDMIYLKFTYPIGI